MKGGGRGELRGVDATLENVISSLFALLLTAVVKSLHCHLSPSPLCSSPLSALSFLPGILCFHLTPAMGKSEGPKVIVRARYVQRSCCPTGRARLGCLWLALKHILKSVASLLASAVQAGFGRDESRHLPVCLPREHFWRKSWQVIHQFHPSSREPMRSQAGGTPLVPVALKEVQRLRLRTCSNELEARGTRRWRSHQLHRTVTSPLGGTKVLQDDDVNDTTKMLLGSLGLLGTVITEYLIVVGAPIRTRTWRLRGGGSW